ncbi:MAG: hypothetical protein ABJB74_17580 [Gemmatimonas sp.]
MRFLHTAVPQALMQRARSATVRAAVMYPMSMQRARTSVGRVVLVFALLACSKTSDAPSVAAGPKLPDGRVATELVTALDTNTMKAMEQRTGNWQEADASSAWRAMSSGGKVRMIDETMHVGETSSRRITHYFTDDGQLAAYYEFRIQSVISSDRSPTKEYVLFKLEFQNDAVSHSEKTVNGAAQPIEPFEIENARKHATVLFDAAKSVPVTSPAKP